MRVLVCTFGHEDLDKVVQAMRFVPYDRLVLIGDDQSRESVSYGRLDCLEAMSGHEIEYRVTDDDSFMDMVDFVSQVLADCSKGSNGQRNAVAINISGGPKLLGDAALFAAFRTGVEAYHCDLKVTRLPVLKDATAKDRFTQLQVRFLEKVGGGSTLDEIAADMGGASRQSAERLMRDLRRSGLVEAGLKSGKIVVMLTDSGREIVRALKP